jgi:hypothetical protein
MTETQTNESGTLELTRDPTVDSLLGQIADDMDHDLAAAYVYGNLQKCPELAIKNKKRTLYKVAQGPNSKLGPYKLTDLDIAWLARSLMGEGGDTKEHAQLYAWTMFNRFMILYRAPFDSPEQVVAEGKGVQFKAKRFASFWRMILDFSQPVNPKWRRDGLYCKPGGSQAKTDRCAPEKLDRRDLVTFQKNITEPQLTYAQDLAVGKLKPPDVTYVDFGQTELGKTYGTPITINKNTEYFLTAENLNKSGASWPGGKVIKVGEEDYIPELDTGTPLPYDYLIGHLRAVVAGDQRALSNQRTIARTDLTARAAYASQAAANQKAQQLANTVQSTTSQKAGQAVVAIATEQDLDPDGNQVGSDSTW